MSSTPQRRRPHLALLALVGAVVSTGCATQTVEAPPPEMAAMGPMLSVERFLQAANARDFEAMARLFGTADGPVKGDRQEIELWMSTIAEVLRHQDYEIVSDRRAPGHEHPTNRIGVDIRKNRNELVRDVPFLVVRAKSGVWLIEQIDLEKITSN